MQSSRARELFALTQLTRYQKGYNPTISIERRDNSYDQLSVNMATIQLFRSYFGFVTRVYKNSIARELITITQVLVTNVCKAHVHVNYSLLRN